MDKNRQQMEAVARRLWGNEWRRPLARAVAPYRPEGNGKALPESTLYTWLAGERPVPGWVVDALPDVAKDRAIEHASAGRAARDLALALRGLTEEDLARAQGRAAARPA